MFWAGLIWASLAWAGDVVHLRTGERTPLQSLLQQGRVLVVVERECLACVRYADLLRTCSQKPAFISLSSGQQTEDFARKVAQGSDVYLLSRDSAAPELKRATPVTLYRGRQRVGAMTCRDLERWMQGVDHAGG